jgi:hypothetical protein
VLFLRSALQLLLPLMHVRRILSIDLTVRLDVVLLVDVAAIMIKNK